MRQNRAETREELFGVLQEITNGPVPFKYPVQPSETGPICCIENLGFKWDATEHYWPVRIYLRASQPTVEESQALLDEMADLVIEACEHAGYICSGSDQYIPPSQTLGDLWQADVIVDVPRQDF